MSLLHRVKLLELRRHASNCPGLAQLLREARDRVEREEVKARRPRPELVARAVGYGLSADLARAELRMLDREERMKGTTS